MQIPLRLFATSLKRLDQPWCTLTSHNACCHSCHDHPSFLSAATKRTCPLRALSILEFRFPATRLSCFDLIFYLDYINHSRNLLQNVLLCAFLWYFSLSFLCILQVPRTFYAVIAVPFLPGDAGRTQSALCYVPIKGLTQVRGMDECMGDDPSFPACGTAKTEWLSWVLSPHSGLAGTTTRRTTPGG